MHITCNECSKINNYCFAVKCKYCGSYDLSYEEVELPPMPKRKSKIPMPEVKPPKQDVKVTEIKMNIGNYYVETKDNYFKLGDDYDDSLQIDYEDIDNIITLLEKLKQIRKGDVL